MKLLLQIALLLLFSATAVADDLATSDIRFLSSPVTPTGNVVIQTFQDSVGALWFVTQTSLNRYTGKTIERFGTVAGDDSSISGLVSRITEDTRGVIWLSSFDGGLNRYDPIKNGFIRYEFDPNNSNSPLSNRVITVYADSVGNIWLGYKNGLSKFNPITGEFKHVISTVRGAPYIDEVSDFLEATDGKLWVATNASGLFKIDSNTLELETHPIEINKQAAVHKPLVSRLASNSENAIWLSTRETGVIRYYPDNRSWEHFAHDESDQNSLSADQINQLYVDRDRRLWTATKEGLDRFDERLQNFVRLEAQIPVATPMFSIYQSIEGIFWVGGYSALAVGSKSKFALYDDTTGGLSDKHVNAFAETSDGSLWVGTDDGLNRLKPNASEFDWIKEYTDPGISSRIVMSLLGEKTTLWVGTFDGGLNRIDIETGETTIFSHSPTNEKSIGANGVTSIYRSSEGSLLIGTYGGGLSIFDESTQNFTNLRYQRESINTLSDNRVVAIFEDSLGNIWIGTENGLNRFDENTKSFISFHSDKNQINSLPSNFVWSFFEDSDKNLWLGTNGGGIVRWSYEDRVNLRPNFLKPDDSLDIPNVTYGIQSDDASNIWISHDLGLTKLSKDLQIATHYNDKDGLQPSEFNFGAAFKSDTGALYFGGSNGFNRVDTNMVEKTEFKPPISISRVMVMNQRKEFEVPYNQLSAIELTYEDVMFSVEFFAADFSAPDLIKYAYKLEGINPDWIISEDARVASFTTLPPGKYNLRLAASSPSGVWNWEGLSIPIIVSPPPWQSPLAYWVYFLVAIACVGYLIRRQRLQATIALERQRELEMKVDERTEDLQEARIAAEQANKAKSDFLATMSHEIRTPMHGMVGMTELLLHTDLNEQQKRFASAAHKSGEALIQLINDILDFSKLEASKIELESITFRLSEVIDEICYLQSEPSSRKGLRLYNICEPNENCTLIGDPTKLRQVIMNLISNAIKFTNDGYVKVVTKIESQDESNDAVIARVEVVDTGIGMDEETQSKIFEAFTQADASTTRKFGGTGLGLSISRQFIDLMDGDIFVESELGHGTKISISIPFRIAVRDLKKPFQDIKAAVFSDSKEMFEMINAHIASLGVSVARIENPEDLTRAALNSDFFITDTFTASKFPLINDNFLAKAGTNGFLVTPLAVKTEELRLYSNWKRISYPLTRSSVKESIESSLENLPHRNYAKFETSSAKNVYRVLVAEDVEVNQRIATEMLNILNCNVSIAVNGLEAVKKFEEDKFDLVFMDCQMPEMDGYEATRRIREIEQKHTGEKRVPIVALTAGAGRQDRNRCRDAGMDNYLPKPFSLADINRMVSQYMGEEADETAANINESILSSPNSETIQPLGEPAEIVKMAAIRSIREVEKQTGKILLPSLIEGYKKQVQEKLDELDAAILAEDSENCYKTAHAVKSMSANVGAEKVRQISAQIEIAGKEGNIEIVKNTLILLEPAVHEFLRKVESDLGATAN